MQDKVAEFYRRSFGGPANLSVGERVASVAFGLAAAAAGLRRGGWLGALVGVAGGALALRGSSGHCALKAALERDGRGRMLQDPSSPEPERHPVGGSTPVA